MHHTDLEELSTRIQDARKLILVSDPDSFDRRDKDLIAAINMIQKDEKGGDIHLMWFSVTHAAIPKGGLGEILRGLVRDDENIHEDDNRTHKLIVSVQFSSDCRNCGGKHYLDRNLFLVEFEDAEKAFILGKELNDLLNFGISG